MLAGIGWMEVLYFDLMDALPDLTVFKQQIQDIENIRKRFNEEEEKKIILYIIVEHFIF